MLSIKNEHCTYSVCIKIIPFQWKK